MKKLFIYALCIGYVPLVTAIALISPKDQEQKIQFSGYVRHTTLLDSRQIEPDTEGIVALFPLKKVFDINGKDINAHGQFNMLNILTRVRAHITGPRIGTTDTSGFIEVDFQGRSNIANILRMRHAYLTLTGNNWTFLAGQTNNPMYVSAFEPRTVAIDNGAPFHPAGRNPQAQFQYTYHTIQAMVTAVAQVDRASDGPFGVRTQYARDALAPNLDVQMQWQATPHLFFAGSLNVKRIVPRLFGINDDLLVFKGDESLNSISSFALLGLLLPEHNLRFATKLTYSQNLREYQMLSGYAVRSRDGATGKQTYTNLQCIGWWADLDYTYNRWFSPGLFVGYTKNCGFIHRISPNLLVDNQVPRTLVFARAPDIAYLIGIMPRAYWHLQELTVAAELQYTRAAFGNIQQNGHICNSVPVNFIRLNISLTYNF